MSIQSLMIISVVSLIVAFVAQHNRSWNAFAVFLAILMASVFALGYRVLGGL